MNQQVSTNVSKGVLSLGYNQEQIATIKETVAKGATDTELYMFLSLAKKYELDPFAKEIWFIKDNSGRVMIQAGRDGFLKTAQRDVKFKGIASFPVYSNDDFELNPTEGEVKHKPNFKERGELIGAWARVEKEGVTPYVAFADFKEYYAGYKDENGNVKVGKYGPLKPQLWDTKPSMMIQKVAQTIALRMTFGINGMYAPEEVEEAQNNTIMTNREIQELEEELEKKKYDLKNKTTKKSSTPKNTPIKKEEAVEVEAEEVKEPTVDLATPAQITMIHTLWNDISKLKEWSGEESEEQYRKNIEAVCKVQSSKELSMQKASLYIDYLTKSLDKLTPKKEMTAEEVEAFINE